MDGGIAALVGWVLLQLIGPSTAAGEWQERAMVEPGEADLRDGAGSAADDEAGIARQGHEEVSRIAHAAGDEDCAGPIGQIDISRGNDTDDLATGSEGALGSDTRCRAAAAADERDAEAGDEFARGRREVVGFRARLGAAEDADLAAAG